MITPRSQQEILNEIVSLLPVSMQEAALRPDSNMNLLLMAISLGVASSEIRLVAMLNEHLKHHEPSITPLPTPLDRSPKAPW